MKLKHGSNKASKQCRICKHGTEFPRATYATAAQRKLGSRRRNTKKRIIQQELAS